ncbi:hypothetical protein [Roseateles cavernae]|uniref:hypothetical protein n=1 Tax=Roseateles cavernae TaxID=3153578 RepID=UPI0032E3C103
MTKWKAFRSGRFGELMAGRLYESIPRVALIDANVFFAPRLCDLFVHLHLEGVIRIHWTSEIDDEWTRNAILKSSSGAAGIYRRRDGMRGAIPDWEVTGYEVHTDRFDGVHPKDRHVAAAAFKLRGDEEDNVVLVTENLKDFPPEAFGATGVLLATPSDFLRNLYREERDIVLSVAEHCRAKLKSPPRTQEGYVGVLMKLNCELGRDLGHAWGVACPVRLANGTLVYRDE